METVTVVLALLGSVLASDWIARSIRIPLPLVQIALGIILEVTPLPSVHLDPDVFFLVFLPPLLFLDGWRIPKRGFFRDGGKILALALGLVLFTVLGIGLFLHWLVPSIPLALAFALAAVLSPTDPIAVSSITARSPLPHRLMHILEGEALLNDASGLVCLRFAIVALLTGSFSFADATLTFLWLAIGGLAIGVGVTLCITFLEDRLLRRLGEDPGTRTLFSLLIPFAVYLIAEEIHVSGILAAVAAGVTMSYAEDSGRAQAPTRIRRTAVWDTVQLVANGAIFVLLGEQLPSILVRTAESAAVAMHHDAWWLALLVVALTGVVLALRFVWIGLSLQIYAWINRSRGEPLPLPAWRIVAMMSIAGVKGAITLAGILTIPTVLADGSIVADRDIVIFLAMGVIMLSLILASISLPFVVPKDASTHLEPRGRPEEYEAKRIAGKAAIRAIEEKRVVLATEASTDLECLEDATGHALDRYTRWRDIIDHAENGPERVAVVAAMERQLRLAGLGAERETLFRLRRERKIEDTVLRHLVREIDLIESRYRP